MLTSQRKSEEPRIILLHGVGLNKTVWHDFSIYLHEKYEIETPELPAHGQSELPPMHNIQDGVSLLEAKLQKSPAIIVGHSLGALITLQLAANHPKNLQAIILLNPVYARDDAARVSVLERANAISRGENDPEPTLSRWFGQTGYPMMRAQIRDMLLANPDGYAAAYRVFAEHQDLPDAKLANISIPVLTITGTLDKNSTPMMSQKIAEKVQNGHFQTINDAGHMAFATHPNDVAKALNHFIDEAVS